MMTSHCRLRYRLTLARSNLTTLLAYLARPAQTWRTSLRLRKVASNCNSQPKIERSAWKTTVSWSQEKSTWQLCLTRALLSLRYLTQARFQRRSSAAPRTCMRHTWLASRKSRPSASMRTSSSELRRHKSQCSEILSRSPPLFQAPTRKRQLMVRPAVSTWREIRNRQTIECRHQSFNLLIKLKSLKKKRRRSIGPLRLKSTSSYFKVSTCASRRLLAWSTRTPRVSIYRQSRSLFARPCKPTMELAIEKT